MSALVPSARNARVHGDEQIEQIITSIKRFGWTIPVLIDEAGEIIAGHGRVMAAAVMGIDEVPVMVAHGWDDETKALYMLADNRIAESATWNDDMLRAEIERLQIDGADLGLTGFSEHELSTILNGWEADASKTATEASLTEMQGKIRVTCKAEDRDVLIDAIKAAVADLGLDEVEVQ